MTQCIDPARIKEGDLMAYVDGAAGEAVKEHIRQCTFCANRAETYRRMEHVLSSALYRASCPTPTTLGLYLSKSLPAGERLVIARHLALCPHCAREMRELERPDDDLISVILDKLSGAVTEVVEALLVAPRPRPVGVRGAPPRQRLYRADDLEIIVGTQPSRARRGRSTLLGQIRPPGEEPKSAAGTEVWLVREGELLEAMVNDLGYFVFKEVSPGEYDIGFGWQGKAVLVREVRVSR